jgi:hypothetical protein
MRLTRVSIRFATGAPALALGVVLGLAGAVHADFGARGVPVGEDGIITRANLDPNEAWPLTIERATFVCDGEAVFLSDGTTQYPLNGVAKTLARVHPEHRRPLEEIWRRDEKVTRGLKDAGQPIEIVRVNITPVLNRGTQWCRTR